MKRLKKIFSLLTLLIVTVFLTACQSAGANINVAERISNSENPVITWGVKADTNLFGQYDIAEGEIVGFDVDMARAITDVITNGQGRAEFVEVTSKTRVPLLINGNIDALIATMTINEGRLEVVNFSDTYFSGGQSLLVPEDSDIQGVDTLTSDHTVLAVKGSNSTQTFREMRPDVPVLDLENYAEAFVALQAGQGDALTTDNAILLGIMEQNPGYHLAGENFTREPYGVASAKGQEDFNALVNDAIDQIIADGTYQEIYNYWFEDLLPNEEVEADLEDADAWVAENVYVNYYENNPNESPEDASGAAASLEALNGDSSESEGE